MYGTLKTLEKVILEFSKKYQENMCIFKKNERFYNKKEMFLLFKTETRKNALNTGYYV